MLSVSFSPQTFGFYKKAKFGKKDNGESLSGRLPVQTGLVLSWA